MRFDVFWRVAALQLVAVALLSVVLAAIFSHGFFEDWGWLAGPAAWLLCAWLTARVVGIAVRPALLGAVLAGLLSAVAVLVDLHWLGAAAAVGLFALWCARLPSREAAWT